MHPERRTVLATLDTAGPTASLSGVRSPAVIVIGEVVRFADAADEIAPRSPRSPCQNRNASGYLGERTAAAVGAGFPR